MCRQLKHTHYIYSEFSFLTAILAAILDISNRHPFVQFCETVLVQLEVPEVSERMGHDIGRMGAGR